MHKLKAAVIGVGNMGKNHVRTYSEIDEIELVAIAELNEDLGKKVSDEFKVKYYKDFIKMMENEKPDLVSIVVPTKFHYQVATECLNRKINTLLEKPIAITVEEGQKLIEIAKSNNTNLLIGHIERHNPAVKKVKSIIEDNKLGKIISIIARRVGGFPAQIHDANIAVDLAIHDVDIVNYLLDELPTEVSINKQKNHIEKREDSVDIFLKYQKASAFVQSNWITPVKIRKLYITGTEGYLEMDYISQEIDFYKSNYEKLRETLGGYSDYIVKFSNPEKIKIELEKKQPLKEELLYFVNLIRNNEKVYSEFALDALKVCLTI